MLDYCVIEVLLVGFIVVLEVFVVDGGVGVNIIVLFKEVVFVLC